MMFGKERVLRADGYVYKGGFEGVVQTQLGRPGYGNGYRNLRPERDAKAVQIRMKPRNTPPTTVVTSIYAEYDGGGWSGCMSLPPKSERPELELPPPCGAVRSMRFTMSWMSRSTAAAFDSALTDPAAEFSAGVDRVEYALGVASPCVTSLREGAPPGEVALSPRECAWDAGGPEAAAPGVTGARCAARACSAASFDGRGGGPALRGGSASAPDASTAGSALSACVMGGGDGDGSRKGVARSRLARSRRARRERKYQNRRAAMIANPAMPPTTPPTIEPVLDSEDLEDGLMV